MPRKPIEGNRYGRVLVVSYAGLNKDHIATYLCRCECGKEWVTSGVRIRQGRVNSCGCKRTEHFITHGQCRGISYAPEYNIWRSMLARCKNPNLECYANYGGRGITVCDRWQESFEDFIADVGSRPSPLHTLDRIDNNAGYEPGNVRWATQDEQNRNKRSNHFLTIDNRTQCVTDWAREFGVPISCFYGRTRRGWAPEEAIRTPSKRQRAGIAR